MMKTDELTVFFDNDTQKEFIGYGKTNSNLQVGEKALQSIVFPSSSQPQPKTEGFGDRNGTSCLQDYEVIKPNLRCLTQYARGNSIPVIGSVVEVNGKKSEKITETMLSSYPLIIEFPRGKEHSNRLIELAIDELDNVYAEYRTPNGIYFEKPSYNVFDNLNLIGFLDKAKIDRAIVYGIATDLSLKLTVLGLLNRGMQCYVVKDAIKGVFPDSTKAALEEMAKAGAKFIATQDVLDENFCNERLNLEQRTEARGVRIW